MNTPLLRTALAAALVAAFSYAVAAQTDAPPVPAALPPFVLPPPIDAMHSLSTEMQAALPDSDDPVRQLDAIMHMQPSAATRKKLLRAFGSEQPWHIERKAGPQGQTNYSLRFDAGSYKADDGSVAAEWAPVSASVSVDRAHRNTLTTGEWPRFALPGGVVGVTASGIRFKSSQSRTRYRGLPESSADLNVAEVSFGGADGVALKDWRMQSAVRLKGKTVDASVSASIAAIKIGTEQIDAFDLRLKFTDIDAQTLSDGIAAMKKEAAIDRPADAKHAITLHQLAVTGKSLALHGMGMELNNLSASYHGRTAAMSGKLTLAGVGEADLGSVESVWKKVVGHFDIRVPVKLAQDLAALVTRKSMEARSHAPVTAEAAAVEAIPVYDAVTGQLLAKGYIRVDGEELRSSLDIKDGKLLVNDKEFHFGGPVPGARPHAAGAPAR